MSVKGVLRSSQRHTMTILNARFSLYASCLAAVLFAMGCASQGSTTQTAAPPPASRPERLSEPVALTPDLVSNLEQQNGFRLGIENEATERWFHLRNKRVALIANSLSMNQAGVHTAESLKNSSELTFARLILLDDEAVPASHCLNAVIASLPVDRVSRLGAEMRHITPALLKDIDAVLYDVPLSGGSHDPDTQALMEAMELCSRLGLRMVVTDRPPLVPVLESGGPISDRDGSNESQVPLPLPTFPGMTAGELANLVNSDFALQADLVTVAMKNWNRKDANGWLAGSRLRGTATPPCIAELASGSPALDPVAAKLRSTARLIDGGSVAEGEPFSVMPGGDSSGLFLALKVPADQEDLILQRLLAMELAGIQAEKDEVKGSVIRLRVENADLIEPVELSLQVRGALMESGAKLDSSVYGSKFVSQGLTKKFTADQIRRRWSITQDARDWPEKRMKYLLYPES